MTVLRRKFLGTCAGGAVAGVMGAPHLFAQDITPGDLPKPSPGEDGSLTSALQLRKSSRSFEPIPIPEQLLSDLLWAAFGVNRPDSGKRTAPSAYNKQEIDIYIVMASGLFLYEPTPHSLKQVSTGDFRKLAGGKKFVKNAPLAIVVCGDPSTSSLWVEDCTIAAVTMQYAAVSQGLGSCWFNIRNMAYNENKSSSTYIAELLGLPLNLDVLCIIAMGYPETQPVPYSKDELQYEKASYYT